MTKEQILYHESSKKDEIIVKGNMKSTEIH